MDRRQGGTLGDGPARDLPCADGRVHDTVGLYVHVPFCTVLCPYCHFTRGVYDAARTGRYLDALVREIGQSGEGEPVDSIYFGGGTPSLLAPRDVARVIAACRVRFAVRPDAEITLEANPESLTPATLEGYREAGVTRLSIGVQSFRDEELLRLGRAHDATRARQAVKEARAAGVETISLDLMLGLPGQTLEAWLASVDALVELDPDHASLYLLELWPGAPLAADAARARWPPPGDDEAADMYESGLERLERAGYVQYEISNVARPGRWARHNLKYWTGGHWYGFGVGAHATVRGRRWTNVARIDDYIARLEAGRSPRGGEEGLTPGAQLEEALFMGLRLAGGVDEVALARRYGVDVWGRYGRDLAPSVEVGLLVRERGRLRLTRRGMLVSTAILSVFVGTPGTVK